MNSGGVKLKTTSPSSRRTFAGLLAVSLAVALLLVLAAPASATSAFEGQAKLSDPAQISSGGDYHCDWLVVDSNGAAHAVWQGTQALFYGEDASGDWVTTQLPGTGTGTGDIYANYVKIAVDQNDRCHVIMKGYRSGEPDTRLWYMDNTSGGWTAPVELFTLTWPASLTRMDLAVDSGGSTHVAWNTQSTGAYSPGQVFYAEVPQGGPSGPPAVEQLTGYTLQGTCRSICVETVTLGEPRVVWDWLYSGDPVATQVYFSEKAGATWSGPHQVTDYLSDTLRGPCNPQLAVDADGHSHVVWQDPVPAGSVWCNVWYSENSSGDFGILTRLSDDVTGLLQRNPRIALDPGGHPHVVWEAVTASSPYYSQAYYACNPSGAYDGWESEDISLNLETSYLRPNISVDYAGNSHVCWNSGVGAMYIDDTSGDWCVPYQVLSSDSDFMYTPGIRSDRFGGSHVYAQGTYQPPIGSSRNVLYYNRAVHPGIIGMNPALGTRGDTVPVSVFGTDFMSEAALTLSGPEGSPNPVTIGPFPTFGSGQVLAAEIDLAGAPAGFYGATVTNPDAIFVTLQHAFEVRYPSPRLTGLKPQRGFRGALCHATVTGSDLRNAAGGITVELRNGAETISADAGTVSWLSPTQVSCDFTIPAGAAVGKWDLFLAHNDDGASDTIRDAFEVSYTPPAVTTLTPASAVTGTGATVSGEITATGGETATERGFRFQYASGAAGWTAWIEHGSFAEGTFSRTLAGLEPGAVYAFQAMALNSGGWSYGAVEYFTTLETATVATNPATSVTGTGAMLHGDLTATGAENAVERGFRFRKSGSTAYMNWSEAGSFGTGSFSHALTGLEPDTGYEYQAMALNSAGWAFGSTLTFKTGSAAPVGGDTTWYLAEGSTAWGFNTRISIQNPNAKAVPARVTCMPTGGTPVSRQVTLPALSQTTITNDALVGIVGGAKDFSTRVESLDGSSPIAVDRTMWWGGGAGSESGGGSAAPGGGSGLDGHSSVGVTAPAKTWYMPEGTTNWGFETWVVVQNPNSGKATCELTYMIEGKPPKTVRHEVAANTRATFSMQQDVGNEDASIMVTSDVPVIPERAVYRNNRRAGHCSTGTTAPAKDYSLAEGSSAWGFTTYVMVQNPNDGEAAVTLTYMTEKGMKTMARFFIPPISRKTLWVNDSLPDRDFSTLVHGSKPIIAERSMYWNGGPDGGEACHDSIGMSAPATLFCLPDGDTSGGCETWTCVQNPNSEPVLVSVTYMTESGTDNVSFTDLIPANSRRSYDMARKGVSGRSAVMVESKTAGKKIVCERSMYWNAGGAGTCTIGGCED